MKYILEVQKIAKANVEVEADNEEQAREIAEKLKYNLHLDWR